MSRNPIKDQVAIVGVGSTGFKRDFPGRSKASLMAEAAVAAIRDSGVDKSDIDGVCGTSAVFYRSQLGPPTDSTYLVATLGLPRVTYWSNQPVPIVFSVMDAMNAIHSGSCEVVVLVHPIIRVAGAAKDPILAADAARSGPLGIEADPESGISPIAYASWAGRYFYEYNAKREHFGYVAVNGRSGAMKNPLAVFQTPLTMDDYLSARMIREPLCLFDMDVPVSGADALVLTTAERARDLPKKPVFIHAASAGMVYPGNAGNEDQQIDLQHHGQQITVKDLRGKSDIWAPDIDVFFAYDGFTMITMQWIENVGWCGPGEGGPFLESNWDAAASKILVNGHIPINPHGGSLSEGGTQGSGHVREAVVQLRGEAGARQVPDASTALLLLGGMFFNSQGLVLRSE